MKNSNIAVWLILVVLVIFVGNKFMQEHEARKSLERLELQMEIEETEAEIELLDDYIELCQKFEDC